MKCQIQLSRKNKKNMSKCCLLKCSPSMILMHAYTCRLTFTTLLGNLADDRLTNIFFIFSRMYVGSVISCKLSPFLRRQFA